MKKTKILAAADTHGDPKLMNALAEKAERENVDLVILCGDIFGWVETKNIIKPFKKKDKRVIIIPGNHEPIEKTKILAETYHIENIHGCSAKHADIGFFGAGGANIGPEEITEEEIYTLLQKAHDEIKGIEKKVMITHMHPAETKSEFSGFKGSKAIRGAVKRFKPEVLIHGHIHEAAGMKDKIYSTRTINVGRHGEIIEV